MTRGSGFVGEPVRVLAGQRRLIAEVDRRSVPSAYRVRFEPPAYVETIGQIASVWRLGDQLEFLAVETARAKS